MQYAPLDYIVTPKGNRISYKGMKAFMVERDGLDKTGFWDAYDFLREHFKYYIHAQSSAQVAVYYPHASRATGVASPYRETILAEQCLLQHGLSYDCAFDDHLDDLGRYAVLVMAGTECLEEKQAEHIRRFVKNGGGVVMVGRCGIFDGWRRRWGNSILADLAGPRVVRLEDLQGAAFERDSYDDSKWKLPSNSKDFIKAVRKAAGSIKLPAVQAPLSMTMEITRKPSTHELLVHLINFNIDKKTGRVKIQVPLKDGEKIANVTAYAPSSKASVTWKSTGGMLEATIKDIDIYCLLVASLK